MVLLNIQMEMAYKQLNLWVYSLEVGLEIEISGGYGIRMAILSHDTRCP